ncbi:hypothetical protein ISF_01576 [Cordyceps fumosorosea ARSEF 2679]|uniref:INO80 chromatin remodeling complex Ies1 n=1 Tax=Cordyceps fumosorosea (strain ARSEF 2679) TaxID=1081104 RepID=A0A168DEA6_CORFA|nr:hypothetical protein ISF_01576 [Cordyceps fumosorosea ARSEF 2679]OAA72503.1 hypothetical protein ISF_01576 [Cordyceps fumosorosea ARSEF 2679]
MAASPTSVAATSEIDHPSSPAAPEGKSFVSRVGSDDEDVGDDTQMTEKPSRKAGRGSQRDGVVQQIGKIRHLKKEDGEPLWRADIQYDFLKAVFDNELKVFTNSYDPHGIGKQNFADLYIDTMARSSKTSKVLRDKLLNDREAAKGMAMVCLLVNVGRMNTTLNFFPEMRAQLRTYHAIPSLQANQDAHAYKQLQDAPRLKSILKGGAEDRQEPSTLLKLKEIAEVPRTNPVNLIFIMCAAAKKVADLHFPDGQEFHDVIMKTQFSSNSRARAFLWLMWFHLESDFTEEGCDENPFGSGVDYDVGVANQGVPRLELMTEEERALENVDTETEKEFGAEKQRTRAKILEMDQAFMNDRDSKRAKPRVSLHEDGPAILPRIRPSKHESDMDSTRSTPPPRGVRASGGRRSAGLKYQIFEGSSPARQGSEGVISRKPRPPTAHQLAVERNRSQRVEYILDKGLRKEQRKSRKSRRREGAIFRAYKRIRASETPGEDSDSDIEAPRNLGPNSKFRESAIGGLGLLADEEDDYGEEVNAYAAAFRRSRRRLVRWLGSDKGVVAPIKIHKANGVDKNGDENDVNGLDEANGDAALDDMDMDDVDGDETALGYGAEQTILADDEADRTEIMIDSDME